MTCEGPIDVLERKRWLCHGPKSTLKVDLFKKPLAFKRWCVEGAIIRGARFTPVAEGCFATSEAATDYVQSLLFQQTASPLAGLCRCRRKRR